MEKKCIGCGMLLPQEAEFCPCCLSPQSEKKKIEIPCESREKRILLIHTVVLAVAIIIALTAAFTIKGPQKYSDRDGTISYQGYEVFASFDYAGSERPEVITEEKVSLASGEATALFLNVYACKDGANEEDFFSSRVAEVYADTEPLNGAAPVSFGATGIDDAPGSMASTYIYCWPGCGTNQITLTLEMLNGDTLQFSAVLTVSEEDTMVIRASDWCMDTAEDLNSLMRSLDSDFTDDILCQLPTT